MNLSEPMEPSDHTGLSIAFEVLKECFAPHSCEAIDFMIAHKDLAIPLFISELQAALRDPDGYAEVANNGCFSSILFLGYWGVVEAHELILEFISLPSEVLETLLADVITEDIPRILLNTCGGNLEKVRKFIENPSTAIDEFCRSSAVQAYCGAVELGYLERGEAISFILDLVGAPQFADYYYFGDCVVFALLSLRPHEFKDTIRAKYELGYISPELSTWDDVQCLMEELEDPSRPIPGHLTSRLAFTEDIHTIFAEYTSSRYCADGFIETIRKLALEQPNKKDRKNRLKRERRKARGKNRRRR